MCSCKRTKLQNGTRTADCIIIALSSVGGPEEIIKGRLKDREDTPAFH
jgi:hypothetical protein